PTSVHELVARKHVHRNVTVPRLIEKILERGEGALTATGSIRATTGKYTGRTPRDKFIVKDDVTTNRVQWETINQPINEKSDEPLTNKRRIVCIQRFCRSRPRISASDTGDQRIRLAQLICSSVIYCTNRQRIAKSYARVYTHLGTNI